MAEDTNADNAPKMIGLDMVLNMTDLDRAQEIWDRAMHPEAQAHIMKYSDYKHGRGPHPGPYQGPVVDFVKARRELDEEDPEWTSCSDDIWEEIQQEREARGLPRQPHPLGEDYE